MGISLPLLLVCCKAAVPSLLLCSPWNENLFVEELGAFVANVVVTLNVMINLLNTRGNSQ